METIKNFSDVCTVLGIAYKPIKFKKIKAFLNDYTPWHFNIKDQFTPEQKVQMIVKALNLKSEVQWKSDEETEFQCYTTAQASAYGIKTFMKEYKELYNQK